MEGNVKYNDIALKNNAQELDFSTLNKDETLFEHHITENDEIWMVQTPAEVDLSSLSNVSMDFDSSVSKLKCKVNKKRKRFNVYSMRNPSSDVNFLLPSKKKKSFCLKSYPLEGNIILQEVLRITKTKDDLECSKIDCSGISISSGTIEEHVNYEAMNVEKYVEKKKKKSVSVTDR